MSARSKARKRALDVLFESEQRSVPALETLAGRIAAADPPVSEYTVGLVEGVVANRERIDELLTTYSQDWSLDRMPAVDRAILRLATFELLWRDDVPDPVVIDEAVTMARTLSTDESPGFVNGLLGRLHDLKPMLAPPQLAATSDPAAEENDHAGVINTPEQG
jgi:N utilization substance protein B